MISVELNNVGKKFKSEWIFKNLTYTIKAGEALVIQGGNGSGKSTLLQIISSFVTPTTGTVNFFNDGKVISSDAVFKHISFASPYLQLIEEFTLTELVNHFTALKPFENELSTKNFIERIELTHASNKYIKQFSSGMKQRLKLGLALCSSSKLVLLDEPISNLDKNAINWYKNLIESSQKNKTIVVCSNAIEDEFWFCNQQLNIQDFKKIITN